MRRVGARGGGGNEKWLGLVLLDAGTSHLATGLRAVAAGFGAFLAMIHPVIRALLAAGLADLGTKLANTFGEHRTAGHFPHRKRADLGATPIERDAANHHLDVFLAQTGGRAVLARLHALVTGVDAGFVYFVRHGGLFFCAGRKPAG